MRHITVICGLLFWRSIGIDKCIYVELTGQGFLDQGSLGRHFPDCRIIVFIHCQPPSTFKCVFLFGHHIFHFNLWMRDYIGIWKSSKIQLQWNSLFSFVVHCTYTSFKIIAKHVKFWHKMCFDWNDMTFYQLMKHKFWLK